MKLGLLTSILQEWTFEEMIDTAKDFGIHSVEVACWPPGNGTRRYAGTSHIDAERVLNDGAYARHIIDYSTDNGVAISSLGYYPNVLDPDPEKSATAISHLEALIRASARLGINMVTTFIGRDQTKTVKENLPLVKSVWNPLLQLAESSGVKIAIENCAMLFGADQWPGGQNIMTSPENWRRIFEILPSNNLGLNFDPSHFVWQMMDYIHPIYEFKDKLFHIHFKDLRIYPEKLARVGVMAYPLDYMEPKLPGLGNIDWSAFISALNDIGYGGYACIEVEDRAFDGSRQKILESIALSKRYLENFIF